MDRDGSNRVIKPDNVVLHIGFISFAERALSILQAVTPTPAAHGRAFLTEVSYQCSADRQ